MSQWNAGVSSACIFCNQFETRDHMFFSCACSAAVWSQLMRGLLLTRYTTIWAELLELMTDNSLDMITTFLIRYAFQSTIHTLWRERNDRLTRGNADLSSSVSKDVGQASQKQMLIFQAAGAGLFFSNRMF